MLLDRIHLDTLILTRSSFRKSQCYIFNRRGQARIGQPIRFRAIAGSYNSN